MDSACLFVCLDVFSVSMFVCCCEACSVVVKKAVWEGWRWEKCEGVIIVM